MNTSKNNVKEIAILGATGHMAKNIIAGLIPNERYHLRLFARNMKALNAFLDQHIKVGADFEINNFAEFGSHKYDVIINCIGIGDPAKLKKIGGSIFKLTEEFDNIILDYLESDRTALYINLSNGIAYGSNFNTPADDNKAAIIHINNISPTDYYSIAKINAEAKHRAFSQFNIIDLRIFGFFSRFVDLKTPYFLSDLVNCILHNKEFVTGNNDMVRDYIDPRDLISLIEKCIEIHRINDVFDVYSLDPIRKFQIIEYFVKEYDLKVNIQENSILQSPTGIKSNYYSLNRKSEMIGYKPKFTSLQAITSELSGIMNK